MALTTREERKAKVIDDYFRNKNYYPHIPFKAFGNLLMEECLRMGEDGLWPSTAAAFIEAGFGVTREEIEPGRTMLKLHELGENAGTVRV